LVLVEFIENIGDTVVTHSIRTYDFLLFLFKCIGQIFSLNSYSSSSIDFLIKQIYVSSIKHLFSFVFLSLFLGSIFIVVAISFAMNFNLLEQIAELLVLFVFNEFSPFFTTIFFILTYSLSSQEEIQNIKKEKSSLFNEIYVPKILNAIFMVPLLSLLCASIMISSGYIVSSFYLNIDLMTYKNMILNSINLSNIFVLLLKGSIFGFISIFIPVYFGHKLEKNSLGLTQAIIRILIIILSMLLLSELLSILIIY